jgi:hypothetical protein
MPILETLMKECMEEASLSDDIVRPHIKAVGALSYFTRYAYRRFALSSFFLSNQPLEQPKDGFSPRLSDSDEPIAAEHDR